MSETAVGAWGWAALLAVLLVLLVVDLKVVMREPKALGSRAAAMYSAVWIGIGVAFGGVVWAWLGGTAAGEYLTGYVIEKSLSIDNVFVWAILLSYFAVPDEYQHRVLFWGVFGALVFRAAFIFGGAALLRNLEWVEYVLGTFLLFTAYRVARHGDQEVDPEDNPIIRRVREIIPHTDQYRGERFFVRERGILLATPLFTVVVAVELTDVLFAVDSVPAVLAVTQREFLVFSSNAFAVLGLRALYFLLKDLKDRFAYLDKGLAVVLAFVALKFLLAEVVSIPTWASLAFITLVITTVIGLSLLRAPASKSR